ncbi:MAG: NAD-binding protein [Proteobacteria bacterium]|nr:NAD-binding protein [Pseudomonadota bacterium]
MERFRVGTGPFRVFASPRFDQNHMETPRRFKFNCNDVPERFPEDAILIIGAGHFGLRAARILDCTLDAPMWIVDKDMDRLRKLKEPRFAKISCEGADFLVRHFLRLAPSTRIIPAIPIHLAFEWLRGYLINDLEIRQIAVPEMIQRCPAHAWEGEKGSVLISYADFRCPDDCPEPVDYCTMTGEKRETPLYEMLTHLNLPGYHIHILRSHQLAPGVGGYLARDLHALLNEVRRKGEGSWLIGTACRCHGTMTAMQTGKSATRCFLGSERPHKSGNHLLPQASQNLEAKKSYDG